MGAETSGPPMLTTRLVLLVASLLLALPLPAQEAEEGPLLVHERTGEGDFPDLVARTASGATRVLVPEVFPGATRAAARRDAAGRILFSGHPVRERLFGLGVEMELHAVPATGGDHVQLTDGRAVGWCEVLPGGRRFAAVLRRDQGLVVGSIDAPERLRGLDRWLDKVWEPDVAPDGRAIVFRGWCARKGDESFKTWLVTTDGEEMRVLGRPLSFPTFGPEGRQVFGTAYDFPHGETALLAVDVATGAERTLLDGIDGGKAWTLSADGRRVVVPRKGELFVHDLESAEEVALGRGREPRIHPRGTKVVFLRDRNVILHDLESGASEDLGAGAHPVWVRGT